MIQEKNTLLTLLPWPEERRYVSAIMNSPAGSCLNTAVLKFPACPGRLLHIRSASISVLLSIDSLKNFKLSALELGLEISTSLYKGVYIRERGYLTALADISLMYCQILGSC